MNAVSRSLYPFEGYRLDIRDGVRMHYLDEGEGAPVVMVHGNPTWSFYYRDLVRALRDERRCIAPDHIGCGFSDKPDDDAYSYTLSQRIEDLGALIDHAVPQGPVDLVLHDWGGMVGMGWAVKNPERVRRLVLLNTAAFLNPKDQRLPVSLWLVRNTALGTLLVRGFNAFSRGATRMAVKKAKLSKEVRDAYCAPYDSWANRIATLRFVQDIPLKPSDPGYEIIAETEATLGALFADTPTIIFWGRKDFVFDDAFLDRWRTLLPHAEVVDFPDCGHYVLEDARDEILPRVRAFLASA